VPTRSFPRFAHGPVLRAVTASEVFGPTLGAAFVRSEAVPQAVTVFSGTAGVDFTQLNPASSSSANQTSITNDTTGEVWWPKGTYVAPSNGFSLKAGQEHRLESPAGGTRSASNTALIDGQNSALYGVQTPASGAAITIRGGLIIRCTNYGIVHSLPNGLTVEDTVLELNTYGALFQYDITFRRSISRTNTIGGFSLTTSGWSAALLENLELTGNNTSDDLDGGGCKILRPVPAVGTLTARGIWSHDNSGRGWWQDTSRVHTSLLEESVFEGNELSGMFIENQYGTTTIKRNYVAGNGTTVSPPQNWNRSPNVLFSASDGSLGGGAGIDFFLNWIDATGDAPAVGLIDPLAQVAGTKQIHVFDNDIWIRSTSDERMGGKLDADAFSTSPLYGGTNTFETNHYHVPKTASNYFSWGSLGGGPSDLDFAGWQAFGHDDGGTMVVI